MLHLPKIPMLAVGVGSGAVYKNDALEWINVTQTVHVVKRLLLQKKKSYSKSSMKTSGQQKLQKN